MLVVATLFLEEIKELAFIFRRSRETMFEQSGERGTLDFFPHLAKKDKTTESREAEYAKHDTFPVISRQGQLYATSHWFIACLVIYRYINEYIYIYIKRKGKINKNKHINLH